MKVVHYLNQLFAGIGGEEQADLPREVRPGALGPGRLLDMLLPDGSQVDATETGDGPLDPFFQYHHLRKRRVKSFNGWIEYHPNLLASEDRSK